MPATPEKFEVRCRHCSVLLRLSPGLAGKQARCPSCKKVFRIPSDRAQARQILCEGCGGSIAVNEVRREVDGKILCSACLSRR